MEILVISDFNALPYNIPSERLNDDFLVYKDKVVAKALKSLLGLTLYDLFVAGIAEEYPEEKWEKLVEGGRYTIEGREYEWAGFTEALRPYVYALHLRDRYDDDTENGVVVSKVENANVISPALRIVNAYNTYVELIGNCNNPLNTFYGFMRVNKDTDYPSWVFEAPERINRFNL